MARTDVPVSPTRTDGNFAENAYSNLRDAILEGRLPPGTPLSRRRLAGEFGMSAVPVGEAMARLEAEGLIETRPRAGSRVRIPTVEEARGNYELREALETHSARLFAESATAPTRKRLLQAAAALDRSYARLAREPYDPRRHAQLERTHMAFHMLIAQATRCPMLTSAIERSRVLLFNWLFMISSEFARLPENWHSDLARTLVEGTPEQAAQSMRGHVRHRKDQIVDTFRKLTAGQARQAMVRGPQRSRTRVSSRKSK